MKRGESRPHDAAVDPPGAANEATQQAGAGAGDGRRKTELASAGAAPAAATPNDREGGKLTALWWRLPERVRDLLWPTATPLSGEARTKEVEKRSAMVQTAHTHIDQLDATDDAQVESAFDAAQAVLDREDARRASVESRLSTVLGMTSIASALAVGMVTAFASNSQALLGSCLTRVAAVVYLYSVGQLVCALSAAIRGVSRQGYLFTSVGDLMPQGGEAVVDYKRRRAKRLIVVADAQHTVDNSKVTAMAVAHRALRNFVISVLVLSCIVVGALFLRASPTSQDADIVRRLRADSRLVDLLRGPRGAPGPRGAAGPRGPEGPSGAAPAPRATSAAVGHPITPHALPSAAGGIPPLH